MLSKSSDTITCKSEDYENSDMGIKVIGNFENGELVSFSSETRINAEGSTLTASEKAEYESMYGGKFEGDYLISKQEYKLSDMTDAEKKEAFDGKITLTKDEFKKVMKDTNLTCK